MFRLIAGESSSVWLCGIMFTRSTADGPLGCIGMRPLGTRLSWALVQTHLVLSLGEDPGSGIAGFHDQCALTFKRNY